MHPALKSALLGFFLQIYLGVLPCLMQHGITLGTGVTPSYYKAFAAQARQLVVPTVHRALETHVSSTLH